MVMDVLSPREKDNNTRWIKVGVGFPKANGDMRILLDAVPLPDPKTGDLVLVVKERTYKDALPEKNVKAKLAQEFHSRSNADKA